MEKLLKIKDVAEIVGLTPVAVYKLIYKRQIPFIKIGGRIRFNPSQISAWISKNSYDNIIVKR
ncbi:MAG: DNA-binding protein [Candidatus Acididesulfobacter diazotrophicus]|jgi:excisionase family DNA binding protein|uniref:DNA-binding protein n=1 Tax=Candidatus Acididesulfobacter diazotrophicus TaxID=2597226 RepID=A0A519BNY1_9DELT|nr:MAG: DNA-binding protein [Candidatus Acididesulfobacter diazotrophicus]